MFDNGTGIPAEEQINIYEWYFWGVNKKLAVRGLGLGLTLSRILSAALGGTLVLKESSPQGTTFQLLLPRGTEGICWHKSHNKTVLHKYS